MVIGLDTVSSQSGRAYCADFLSRGYTVFGFSHESVRGKEFVNTVNDLEGIFLDRPQNSNGERKAFFNLMESYVGHDLKKLVENCDFIILSEPSNYFADSVDELIAVGILEKRIPIILSPSRTFAVPYLWKKLGDFYPIAAISTCPYSCKAPRPDTAYIKRRKRNFTVSLEGKFTLVQVAKLGELFPQALFNRIPATTSLGNIGAVLHPATYLLNYETIVKDKNISFYMTGIANNKNVGETIEQIDQMRLLIADRIGLKTFGLIGKDRENEWQEIMDNVRKKEHGISDKNLLRKIRRDGLEILNNSIPSLYHWLDYTYGVTRNTSDSICEVIRRTPTYQRNSVPQDRYVFENIPTGLIPLRNLADRLGINHDAADKIINMCKQYFPQRDISCDRTLREYSDEYIFNYLRGDFFDIRE